jgi:hypothetical protein
MTGSQPTSDDHLIPKEVTALLDSAIPFSPSKVFLEDLETYKTN